MTRLSVNVNKLATLRNSRGKNLPDVGALAAKIIAYGAHGLTVHPRPDGRHIRFEDVTHLAHLIRRLRSPARPIEFNVEGYPSPDFIARMNDLKPDQVTLVPDPPEALTSNFGWNLAESESQLAQVLLALHASGARVSLFVDPTSLVRAEQAAALGRLRPARIELYTEAYADHFAQADRETVTATYACAARIATDLGLGINAGHDLNQKNLGYLIAKIPTIDEVSIGHALICEALEQGLEQTIQSYLHILESANEA